MQLLGKAHHHANPCQQMGQIQQSGYAYYAEWTNPMPTQISKCATVAKHFITSRHQNFEITRGSARNVG
jgi:hypothetical protein